MPRAPTTSTTRSARRWRRALWVICDRFSIRRASTRARPAGSRRRGHRRAGTTWSSAPTFPDLTLILDIPAELGLGRAPQPASRSRSDTEADRLREARPRLPLAAARRLSATSPRAEPRALRAHRRGAGRPRRVFAAVSGHAVQPRLLAAAPLMARAPAIAEIEELPEADRLEGFPHPRETKAL